MMMMIPEAWAGNPLMDEERRAFYEYHAALMEPWDGPAAIAFTDGRQIGATLDRNGLRPARYFVTRDDRIIMASEMGVLPIPEKDIVTKWRLQPGKMLLVDLDEGRLIPDEEIKATLAESHPYKEWLERTQIVLEDLPAAPGEAAISNLALLDRQQTFGYTQEDLQHPDVADGDPGRGSGRLDGQRHADLGAVRQAEAALHLFQAELRPGDQPADRSDPRGAGHEPGLDHRTAAQPVRPRRQLAHQAPRSAPADPHQRGPGEDPRDLRGRRRPFQVAHARHHLAGRARRRRHEGGARHALRPRRGRGARRHQHHHPVGPPGRRGPHPDPVAARLRGGASSPDPPGTAHLGRAGGRVRRAARGASFRLPRRLRRGGDQSLSRLRDADRDEGRAAAEARREGDRQALHQVDRQGPAQGDVQDGHLDLSVLLRRADFRRGRSQVRFRRGIFHRHRDADRRRRAHRDRRGDGAAPSRRLRRCSDLSRRARRRRRIPVSRARRGPCLDGDDRVGAAARRARQSAGPVPRLRQGQQRAVRAAAHHPRPVPHQDRRKRTGASRCRSRRSSRRSASSGASPPAPCRSARSRARRIPRSPSP